jgi:hypothetical protein
MPSGSSTLKYNILLSSVDTENLVMHKTDTTVYYYMNIIPKVNLML